MSLLLYCFFASIIIFVTSFRFRLHLFQQIAVLFRLALLNERFIFLLSRLI